MTNAQMFRQVGFHEDTEESREKPVRLTDKPAKIRTGYLPNTSLGRCH